MTNKRKEEIENLAVELLKEFNLYRCDGAGPIFVKDDLKKFFNFSFREAELESDFLGAIFKGKKEVKIVVNSKIDNQGRKNFTYAHEMGHYYLMHELNDLHKCSSKDIESGLNSKKEQEVEANYFASCFLLPKDYLYWNFCVVLTKYLQLDIKKVYINRYNLHVWRSICSQFEKTCGVSSVALRIRLEQYNLLEWNLPEMKIKSNPFNMFEGDKKDIKQYFRSDNKWTN